jgi:hypothetical protein
LASTGYPKGAAGRSHHWHPGGWVMVNTLQDVASIESFEVESL